MPKKARQTNDGSRNSFTIRLPPQCGSWMYELAQETDKSLTDLVLGFLDDARTWWGLNEELAADLHKDADSLNLSQRDYILYLLTERCAALREHGTGWEKDKLAVLLSKRR